MLTASAGHRRHQKKSHLGINEAQRAIVWQRAWLDRSQQLVRLGFPDLAAADAPKAILMCNAGLEHRSLLGAIVCLEEGVQNFLRPVETFWEERAERYITTALMEDRCHA